MTIPIPVLDDRSFSQLVAEARARVPVHTPEWTNLNPSDPGMTIVELFAFLSENLLYRSNRLPAANRMKFLDMLGISLVSPSPGVGLVAFSNERGPVAPIPVLAGTQVRAGQVPFQTVADLAVQPVTAAVYYKRPLPALDEQTRARYELVYQTFLGAPSDELSFYEPVALAPLTTGAADPVVDLGDPVAGTIDRSLWVALLAQPDADRATARAAIAGQTLSIGVYPATRIPGRSLPPQAGDGAPVDPGLVFEVAAPEPDPTGTLGEGYGLGPARYARLPISRADPVLQAPGVVQVTLPEHEKLLVWAFDPQEEGTGDYPPRVEDDAIAARILTWLRLRLPPLPQDASTPAGNTPAPAGSTTPLAASKGSHEPGTAHGAGQHGGCGCAGTIRVGGVTQELATAAAQSEATGRLSWVGVNAVQVVQSVPVNRERLGVGTGTPFQTFTLANTPVLAEGTPGGFVLTVEGLDGATAQWHPVDDIYAAKPDELAFLPDWSSGRIITGSGLQGSRVPLGATVWASYSYGGGVQGQAAVGAINRSPALPSGLQVSNPVPTWGASAGESLADGEAAITRWLHHRDRLVTGDDFRDLVRRTPRIDLGRVEVLPLFHPDRPDSGQSWPGMVTLMVIPRSDPLHPRAPAPDRLFLNAVCDWLEPRRLVTTEVHVRGPVYQQIWVSVGIEVLAGQVPSLVAQAVRDAVSTYLSPLVGGLPAGGSAPMGATPGAVTGTGWPLGVDVRSQDIEAVATRVPGVRYVNSVRIAAANSDGTVSGGADPVQLRGLALPSATVFTNIGPAEDPAAMIGSSQPTPATQVAVPVVPATC